MNAKTREMNLNGFAGKNHCALQTPFKHLKILSFSRKSDLFLTTIYLLFAALLKSVLTVFTFGSRVPAVCNLLCFYFSLFTYETLTSQGIFIPSMCVGACVGRLLGILIFSWQR